MVAILDLVGKRIHRLLVVEKMPERNAHGNVVWRCLCDCGEETFKVTGNLLHGNTKSCGCWNKIVIAQRNKANATHGMSRTPIYGIWNGMLQRCNNPENSHYSEYGSRGIKVCERWHTFENFYADMGERPSSRHTLDREENDGNYEPSNCRWATPEQQANNRRNTRLYCYEGQEATAPQFARRLGLNLSTLEYRLAAGWSIQDAIEKPIRNSKR